MSDSIPAPRVQLIGQTRRLALEAGTRLNEVLSRAVAGQVHPPESAVGAAFCGGHLVRTIANILREEYGRT